MYYTFVIPWNYGRLLLFDELFVNIVVTDVSACVGNHNILFCYFSDQE